MADQGTQVEERAGAYAVIGAGMSGLAALKALLETGFDADWFERESDVGGNWNFDARNSRVYRSTHLISSKPFTQYPDFPMPDAYPDYPTHTAGARLLQALRRPLRAAGAHRLRPRRGAGRAGRRRSARGTSPSGPRRRGAAPGATTACVIANGHNWYPKMPATPGSERSPARSCTPRTTRAPTSCAAAGCWWSVRGNTGCDIAVEGAQNAAATCHSTRRGYYYNPKFVVGRPSDQIADTLLAAAGARWPCAG